MPVPSVRCVPEAEISREIHKLLLENGDAMRYTNLVYAIFCVKPQNNERI